MRLLDIIANCFVLLLAINQIDVKNADIDNYPLSKAYGKIVLRINRDDVYKIYYFLIIYNNSHRLAGSKHFC